ncbi:hypothetical protein FQA39_LY14419 [Lamprigera yunnana]|nr:hypothetical protein FQA39_LY14419 [Lamprigera yunnana]
MSITIPTILNYYSQAEEDMDVIKKEDICPIPRAKKRRLDHLSWEEKIQRKKLKNRVAAQTSRDRKKAKMEEMEQALHHVMKECKELRNANKRLSEENAKLKKSNCNCNQNRSVECDVQSRSAASVNPLPKGLDMHSAAALKAQTATAVWKIVLACLLYQTCSMSWTGTSTLTLWKNSRRASCKISPQIWRQLLKRQIVKYLDVCMESICDFPRLITISEENANKRLSEENANKRLSEENANKRLSEENANKRLSEENANKRLSEENANKRLSEENANKRLSEENANKRLSEENANKRLSEENANKRLSEENANKRLSEENANKRLSEENANKRLSEENANKRLSEENANKRLSEENANKRLSEENANKRLSEENANKRLSEENANKRLSEENANKRLSEENANKRLSEENANKRLSEENANKRLSEENANKRLSEENANKRLSEENANKRLSEENANKRLSEENANKRLSEENANKRLSEENANKRLSEENANKRLSEENANKRLSEENANKRLSEENANKRLSEENANKRLSEENANKRLSEENANKRLSEENANKRLSEENANKRLSEENANKRLSEENANKRLSEENAKLKKSNWFGHALSSGFESSNSNSSVEDSVGLPSISDLLNELDRDVDIDSLEELTQSLLQDIAADLEAAAEKANCEEPNGDRKVSEQPLVGSSPEQLEPNGCVRVKSEPGLEQEISPYLLLHHNYSAKQPESYERLKNKKTSKRTNLNTKTKPKPIMPKITNLLTSTSQLDSNEILYGTLDHTTNCITIIVDDNNLHLSEAVTEIVTTEEDTPSLDIKSETNTLELPEYKQSNGERSPHSFSDCGYESLDSPGMEENEVDIWDQSVCELFPML